MNLHKLARLTPLRRAEMEGRVISGEINQQQASQIYGVSVRTVSKWVGRYKREGADGMEDRSFRPHNKSTNRLSGAYARSRESDSVVLI